MVRVRTGNRNTTGNPTARRHTPNTATRPTVMPNMVNMATESTVLTEDAVAAWEPACVAAWEAEVANNTDNGERL